MKAAENSLVQAVRDQLRLAGFGDSECNAEVSESQIPATVGQLYAAVVPAGWRPGPRHSTSGGVNDLVYGVRVAVIRRIGEVPKDRRREVFLANFESLSADVDRAYEAIDWNYGTLNLANTLIVAAANSTEGFVEPLRLAGDVGPVREVGPEFFGAVPGDTVAGMMRVLPFGGARRISTKAA